VFKYGHFLGMSPLCAIRLREYPELRKPINEMDTEELEDAQHQWTYFSSSRVMQPCWEDDCRAVRPVPMNGYATDDQNFILQTFYRWLQGELGEPLPEGQLMRHVP
jgi:hypothetical protein